jgi:hypothetical protein
MRKLILLLLCLLLVVPGVMSVPLVYHPAAQVTNGTFAIGNFIFQSNVTSLGWFFGKYDWTILAGLSTNYLAFNGTKLQFNETYLNSTILDITNALDNDTTYTAGKGLNLTGTVFNVNTTKIQQRVSGTCAAGSSIREIAEDGTVICWRWRGCWRMV